MKYKYSMQADNVYVIDTKMFGFDHYMSAYLIKGKELALIDTGLANQVEVVRAGIKAHGFSISDISYIFVTHEHHDHCGNVGSFLRENPKIKAYIHPLGKHRLTDPESVLAQMKGKMLPKMIARFGTMEPVPASRLQYFSDGDTFDLGDGEKLKIMFTPGHQPGSVVIFAEKYRGLFINDLVGNYFADADAAILLTPNGSDTIRTMESLRRCLKMPATRLFLGHFGISDTPKMVMQRALNNMQAVLEIGAKCVAEGRPELIAPKVNDYRMKEVEKIRAARGEVLYNYIVEELIPHQSVAFANYYTSLDHQQVP